MTDNYNTPRRPYQAEITERKSRFVAALFPVKDEEEADGRLKQVRREHYNADHHCYAFRLASSIERRGDDGEPAGTAGEPILKVLAENGLYNAIMVVTRYFGGIKLGAGGLIRAYSGAAALAAAGAEIVNMRPFAKLRVSVPYDRLNPALASVKSAGGIAGGVDYAGDAAITAFVPTEEADAAIALITDATMGKAAIERLGDKLAFKDGEGRIFFE